MTDKTQNTEIKSEGESSSTNHFELQKPSNQNQQSYKSRGNGGSGSSDSSGNSGRGRSNLKRGITNQTVNPRQAFVGECK